MTQDLTLTLLTAVIALSAAMLAWLAYDIGTATLEKYHATFTSRTRFQAQEFFLFIDPRKLFAINMAIIGLGCVVVWIFTGSVLLVAAAVVLLSMMPRLIYAFLRKRRLEKFEAQLPDALLMISGGMRAGVGLSSAIQQLVQEAQPPISQEFSLLLREQRLGLSLEQTLTNLNRRVPTQTTTLVVSAMRIASETGGGLAETLERTAHTIRSRLQMEGKIGALTAQGKMQAWVVGLLPVALLLILQKMEPEAMGLIWTTRIGWATLGVLAFMEFMGVYLIRKIIAIDV